MSTPNNEVSAHLMAELERLRAENTKLKSRAASRVTFKITAKGGISVYGLGRYPTTLYRSQWTVLFTAVEALKTFIKDNDEEINRLETASAEAKKAEAEQA